MTPTAVRIAIGLDPAAKDKPTSDETGIVICALATDGCGYVLDDLSGIYSPERWAQRVSDAYWAYQADVVVAEVNNGGDMVPTVIRLIDDKVRVVTVDASRGKAIRADPVVALYEKRMVFHTRIFPELEEEQVSWDPTMPGRSPSRLDALVWALTYLMVFPKKRGGIALL